MYSYEQIQCTFKPGMAIYVDTTICWRCIKWTGDGYCDKDYFAKHLLLARNGETRPHGFRAVSLWANHPSAAFSRSPGSLEPECLSIVLAGKKESSRKKNILLFFLLDSFFPARPTLRHSGSRLTGLLDQTALCRLDNIETALGCPTGLTDSLSRVQRVMCFKSIM